MILIIQLTKFSKFNYEINYNLISSLTTWQPSMYHQLKSAGLDSVTWELYSSLFSVHFRYSHVLNILLYFYVRDTSYFKFCWLSVFTVFMASHIINVLCFNTHNESEHNVRNIFPWMTVKLPQSTVTTKCITSVIKKYQS